MSRWGLLSGVSAHALSRTVVWLHGAVTSQRETFTVRGLIPVLKGIQKYGYKNEIWLCLATNRHQQWECWKKKPAIPQSAGRSPFTLDFLCCDDRCTSTRSRTAKSPDSDTHTHTHTPLPHPPPAAPENALSMMSPAIPALQREQKGSPQ